MIKPFVELSCGDEAQSVIKKHGLEIKSVECLKLKNGFIVVCVHWKNPTCEAKYAVDGGSGSVNNYEVWKSLKFPNLKFRYPDFDFDSTIELQVGLQKLNENGEPEGELGYNSMYFQNLKYGAAVYFGPRNWNDLDGAEILFKEE